MEKTVIIYASKHHGSTRSLAEAIADRYGVTLINAEKENRADLSGYSLIGFASGIDFGKFYDSVEQFLENNLPYNRRVFFLYTCARVSSRFTESIKAAARRKGAVLLGEYGCRGFNTYGPWKLVGGMNKGHPTPEEKAAAIGFYESLSCRPESPEAEDPGKK